MRVSWEIIKINKKKKKTFCMEGGEAFLKPKRKFCFCKNNTKKHITPLSEWKQDSIYLFILSDGVIYIYLILMLSDIVKLKWQMLLLLVGNPAGSRLTVNEIWEETKKAAARLSDDRYITIAGVGKLEIFTERLIDT